jgi:branched-chain amino acid transport system permease protein
MTDASSPAVWDQVRQRPKLVAALIIAILALVAAPHLSTSDQLKWTLWLSFGVVALSLSFIWGKVGIFSFGQNAIFGLGAYGYAVFSLNVFPMSGETGSALLVAGIVGAVFSAILGYVMFYGRVGDVYLSVLTLAVTLILYTVVSSTAGPDYRIGEALLGGFNGMPGLPPLVLWMPGLGSIELGFSGLLQFAICMAVVVYIALSWVSESNIGRILEAIRENDTRMELLGYDIRFWRWFAFVLAGFIAGLGGGLFAAWGTFTNPSVFALSQAAMVIIWVMVGGRGSLAGAFVGVAVVQWITDSADKVVSQQTPLILGVTLILTVLLFPSGLVPSLAALGTRAAARLGLSGTGSDASDPDSDTSVVPVPAPAHPESIGDSGAGSLEAKKISRSFGGLKVLQNIDLEFGDAPIHVIIGPNGAGKSTFFNVLTGRIPAEHGNIVLNGMDVTQLQSFQRARQGLGIKTQIPSVFESITVGDSIALALRSMDKAERDRRVDRILWMVGLSHKKNVPSSSISHGEQQWLEIAMVVAQDPSVILLDEPVAGMSQEEKRKTLRLIRALSESHTIIVVEHDMAFVRALKAPVAMLHQGGVFREGGFDEVCNDPEVIDVYLGRGTHAAAQ